MEQGENECINIRVELKGKEAEKFRVIKEYHGLENNTDICRLLLNKEHREITGQTNTVKPEEGAP